MIIRHLLLYVTLALLLLLIVKKMFFFVLYIFRFLKCIQIKMKFRVRKIYFLINNRIKNMQYITAYLIDRNKLSNKFLKFLAHFKFKIEYRKMSLLIEVSLFKSLYFFFKDTS